MLINAVKSGDFRTAVLKNIKKLKKGLAKPVTI